MTPKSNDALEQAHAAFKQVEDKPNAPLPIVFANLGPCYDPLVIMPGRHYSVHHVLILCAMRRKIPLKDWLLEEMKNQRVYSQSEIAETLRCAEKIVSKFTLDPLKGNSLV